MERAIETQRLRLLRLVAGLLVAIGFLSVAPVSRGFSVWACGYVGSVLSRLEAAVGYLVIAQARGMAARLGKNVDRSCFFMSAKPEFSACAADASVLDMRQRLCALRAVLMDLPRHALRLLRRIEKASQGDAGADRRLPRPDTGLLRHTGRRAAYRIERPPDPSRNAFLCPLPPSGFRAGGASGWAVSAAA